MKGFVDDESRALVTIRVGLPKGEATEEVLVWVDTAFNGSLVLPESVVSSLGLPQQSTAKAILADGTKVDLETFGCGISWFGKEYVSQISTNKSQYGLLGTMLLNGRRLVVDYDAKTVAVD